MSESSFVTVAALAGDVPLLTPVPFARAGAMARYELLGNKGQPLRNVFFLEDLVAFTSSVHWATRHSATDRQIKCQCHFAAEQVDDNLRNGPSSSVGGAP